MYLFLYVLLAQPHVIATVTSKCVKTIQRAAALILHLFLWGSKYPLGGSRVNKKNMGCELLSSSLSGELFY